MAGEQLCRKGSGDAGRLQAQQESAECFGNKRANHIPEYKKHSITSSSRQVIIVQYLLLVQPHLEYSVLFWTPQHNRDVKVLKYIQKRATKLVEGLEGMSYKDQLRTLGFSSLEKRRLIAHCSMAS